jgi:L-amino acid N-acyltransferase YncA
MIIREATIKDLDAVWEIFKIVIETGDTFVFSPGTSKEDLKTIWFGSTMKTFVAEESNKITGTYFIKPNQVDLGSHIANCGYMVHPLWRGKAIGRLLCEHSINKAHELGYRGMQFNIVVSSNATAVKLWEKCGFKIIGTIPGGFHHMESGYVDAFIMFRAIN